MALTSRIEELFSLICAQERGVSRWRPDNAKRPYIVETTPLETGGHVVEHQSGSLVVTKHQVRTRSGPGSPTDRGSDP